MNIKKFLFFICVFGLIALGAWVRTYQFEYHFSHFDDIGPAKSIIDAQYLGRSSLWAVPTLWTYAPLQYLITSQIISNELTYREILFWGRLPSLIFGIISLLLMSYLGYLYDSQKKWISVILPTLFLVCAWEHIIFSKLMYNYALGVLGFIIGLIVFLRIMHMKSIGFVHYWILAGVLIVLSYAQYSIVFEIPAMLASLMIYLCRRENKSARLGIFHYIFSGVVVCAAMFPAWFFFLKDQDVAGKLIWLYGKNNEFLFQSALISQDWLYPVKYFLGNFWEVFRVNIAFFPEGFWLGNAVSVVLFIFLWIGVISYSSTQERIKKYVGLVILLTVVTWMGLAITGKLPWAPSRHNFIFAPVMYLMVVEGVLFINEKLKNVRFDLFFTGIVSTVILGIFCLTYSQFIEQRNDPFNEQKIVKLMADYGVDTVLRTDITYQVDMMKGVRDYFSIFGDVYVPGLFDDGPFTFALSEHNMILWISQHAMLTRQRFEEARKRSNEFIARYNKFRLSSRLFPWGYLTNSFDDYKIIYKEERSSEEHLEYTRKLPNPSGSTNSYYVYLLKKVKK